MSTWLLLVILISIMVVVIGLFAMRMAKKQKVLLQKYPGYPKGHFKNQSLGVGVALDNIGLGIAIGLAIGAAIGTSNEAKHKDEVRPLTEEEKDFQKEKLVFASGILVVGLVVFLLFYFLNK